MLRQKDRFEEIRTKIAAVAANASESDLRGVDQIITQAKVGDYQSEKLALTPPVAAVLFLKHNSHNRDWKGQWSLELLRRLESGQWKNNGDTLRFYKDGTVADAQNRLAMIALSGKIVDIIAVYGLNRDAILTIDNGKARYASDAAKLDGVEAAAEKERIVKLTSSYLVRMGNRDAELRSEAEVNEAIRANNGDLTTALSVAEDTCEGIVSPKLKRIEGATLTYLMTKYGKWPLATVKEKLALLQTGVSKDGEADPLFQAAKLIEKSRQATNRKEKLTTNRQLGIAVFAIQQVERGIKAISSAKLREVVKTAVPHPDYPAGNGDGNE